MDFERNLLNYCKTDSKSNGQKSNKDYRNIPGTSRNNNGSNIQNINTEQNSIKNDSENSNNSSIRCNSVSSTSLSSSSPSPPSLSSSASSKYSNTNQTLSNSTSQNTTTSATASATATTIIISNNITSNNKRKRRCTLDDEDHALENPTKRAQIMSPSKSLPSTSQYYQSDSQPSSVSSSYPGDDMPLELDTRSSSECLSSMAEYDLGTPSPDDVTLVSPSPSSSTNSSAADHLSRNKATTSSSNPIGGNKWQRLRGDTTPHSEKRYKKSYLEFEAERSLTPTPETRPCPLPALSWANSVDVWNAMCLKDEIAAKDRSSTMLNNHPGLQPRMRAILLDWLIEVCEVYKLHRETYYLSVDFLDRYLTTQKNVQKTHLQLIGITCLFVAAKVEEIYPPKIGEFAYVTDGACQEDEIINYELLLLNALGWNISPVTIMGWMSVYMQLNASNRTAASFTANHGSLPDITGQIGIIQENVVNKSSDPGYKNNKCINNNSSNSNNTNTNNNNHNNLLKQVQDKHFLNFKDNGKNSFNHINNSKTNNNNNNNNCASTSAAGSGHVTADNDSGISINCANTDDAFIYPQFSGFEFVQTAQIVDLCTLDLGLGDYPYSVIAAAAITHTFGRETAMRVSGYEWNIIAPCVRWMEPFFQIVSAESQNLFLLEQNEQVKSKFGLGHICPNIVTDDSHIIQTHTTSMAMFDKVLLRREQYQAASLTMIKQEASPAVTVNHLCPEGLLTPPASSRKPLDDEPIENESNLHNTITSSKS